MARSLAVLAVLATLLACVLAQPLITVLTDNGDASSFTFTPLVYDENDDPVASSWDAQYYRFDIPTGTYAVSINASVTACSNPIDGNDHRTEMPWSFAFVGKYLPCTQYFADYAYEASGAGTLICDVTYESTLGTTTGDNWGSYGLGSGSSFYDPAGFTFTTGYYWYWTYNSDELQVAYNFLQPGQALYFAVSRDIYYWNEYYTGNKDFTCTGSVTAHAFTCPEGKAAAYTNTWDDAICAPLSDVAFTANVTTAFTTTTLSDTEGAQIYRFASVPTGASLIWFNISIADYNSLYIYGANGVSQDYAQNSQCDYTYESADASASPMLYNYYGVCYNPRWTEDYYIIVELYDPSYGPTDIIPRFEVITCPDGVIGAGYDQAYYCGEPLTSLTDALTAATSGQVNQVVPAWMVHWYIDVPAFTWDELLLYLNTTNSDTLYVRDNTYSNDWSSGDIHYEYAWYGNSLVFSPYERYHNKAVRWVVSYECYTTSHCTTAMNFGQVASAVPLSSNPINPPSAASSLYASAALIVFAVLAVLFL